MRKAICQNTTIHLSDLTADPVLQRFFRSGPGSEGFTVPAFPVLRSVRPLDGLIREAAPHA